MKTRTATDSLRGMIIGLLGITLLLSLSGPLAAHAHSQRISNQSLIQTFKVGFEPGHLTFDGTSIWVVLAEKKVVKLRASDGVIEGSFDVGRNPQGILFDGADIWVANYSDGTVTK